MKPRRIILVRHGESEANIDKSIHGLKPDYTAELTPAGIAQADSVGAHLKLLLASESIFFYVSPYWRTRMTFEQIVKHFDTDRIKLREEPRLREQEWGHIRRFEETSVIEKERDGFGTFYFRLPDGESGADVYDRVSDFIGTLHRDFEKNDYPENVIIITHGMTIRVFLMRWFHWTVEQFEEHGNPKNCEIVTLERGDNEKYILCTAMKKRRPSHKYQRPIKFGLKAQSPPN